MFRLVGIALLLIARNCVADTIIQEGDYEPVLTITEDGLLMTGGQVDKAILWGSGPYNVEGGILSRTELESGNVAFSGGKIGNIARTDRGGGSFTSIGFEGHYFRVHDSGLAAYNTYVVEGWLADGSFISTSIVNGFDAPTRFLPVTFNIVPSSPPEGDLTQNWSVDLEDLNYVRNHFGEDGMDLSTLNLVRNNFGVGQFSLTSGYYEVGKPQAVPEPPAWVWIPASLLLLYLFHPRKELE